jgi:hypothetical protein
VTVCERDHLIGDVFDAAKRYVEARRQFLNAYNRADARKKLDAAWSELADLFPVLPESET